MKHPQFKEQLKCPCGKVFEDYKVRKRTFCSQDCSEKAQRDKIEALKIGERI